MKKRTTMAGQGFTALFAQISKAALIDTLYCACQLGTDESEPQIATQAARNAVIALRHRGDRVPRDLVSQADNRLDSDADGD